MQIGISTACFYGKYNTEEAAKIITGLDADCCEVFMQTYSEYNRAFGAMVRNTIGTFPVRSTHVVTQQVEQMLFSPQQRQREDAYAMLEGAFAAGAEMGTKVHVFHGRTDIKRDGRSVDWEGMVALTRNISAIASNYGIKMAWENVYWCCFSSPEFATILRKNCPNEAAFVLDIKQALRSKRSVEDYLDAMGDGLCHLHVCDYTQDGTLCLPGRGDFDFATLFERLRDTGYQGSIIIEVYESEFTHAQELQESVAFLKHQASLVGF